MIGQRLSHYRIIEQIGAGGMGVVYRAHDEQLDRDVAIKVLPPGSLADESARKQFRKEALSLARLNHPNVATVHEFGSQDGVDFLVTEYIEGVTLDASLARGSIPTRDVVHLGLQLTAGLAAAHDQGIIHRDLKPGNLRVTPDGRLKILDFGLAQLQPRPSELGETATMTHAQDTRGTPPYMSPEQLSGRVADIKSDIWAAGAVLYEMSTGKRPFPQSSTALLISAILNQEPIPPSKLNRDSPSYLDAVILKAMAREPAERHQSARELGAELAGKATFSALRRRASAHLRLAVAAAVVVVAVALAVYLLPRRSQLVAPAAENRRRSVAVLGFKNVSANPEKSWLSTALSEMLTTELSQGEQLRTIPGESVAQMKASLNLPDADSFSRQTLKRIRQNLGSDDVVVGSFIPLGDGQLRLDVTLQDTLAGETLVSISEKGNETEIDNLVSRAGEKLRGRLGVAALSDAQSALVRASLPANPDAARLYALGLQKLRLSDALNARNLLEKAAALAPEHAPTHSALAEAWSTLGYQAKAKEQARRAVDLASTFSQEERLLIEGRLHELTGEPPQAMESYRTLWTLFPDRVDYGLLLIRAQIDGGRGSDAETTLSEIRKLSLSEADVARTDFAEAQIAHSLSDFKRCQLTADQAASRARAVGANLIVAEALRVEAMATERMGESEKALRLLNESRDLYNSAGFRQGAARTMLMAGDVSFDQGDLAKAKKQYEEVLAVFREIGDQKRIRSTVERIGNVYYAQGKLRESENYYNQALRIDRDFNDPGGLASDYGNLANAMDGLGELNGALKMQQLALATFNEIGDRRGAAATLNNLGNLFVEMGNLDEAKRMFEQSLSLARQIAHRRGEPFALSGLGNVLQARGEFVEARQRFQEVLTLCAEMKQDDIAGQAHVALAEIALYEGKLAEAEAFARQAATSLDQINSSGRPAAHAVLAKVLLKAGNIAEARKEAEMAVAISKTTAGQTSRYDAVLADSRVMTTSGHSRDALSQLASNLASARKYGYRLYEYELRLAMGEIGLASGAQSAPADLHVLEADARIHGALLIASRAAALGTKERHH